MMKLLIALWRKLVDLWNRPTWIQVMCDDIIENAINEALDAAGGQE